MSKRCLQQLCCCPSDCSPSVTNMCLFLLRFIFNPAGTQQLLHHRRAALTRPAELCHCSDKNTDFSCLLKGVLGTSWEVFSCANPSLTPESNHNIVSVNFITRLFGDWTANDQFCPFEQFHSTFLRACSESTVRCGMQAFQP